MKKLMIGLAAAGLCGAVFADVTSANVVGYANDGLAAQSWKPVCAQFLTIGKEKADMKLNVLVPGGTWAASDYIKVIDEYAAVGYQAKYRTFAMLSTNEKKLFPGATEETFVPGWYECGKTGLMSLTATFRGDDPLPYGCAVLVKAAKAGAYITSNGEVVEEETGSTALDLVAQEWRFIGNATPIDRKLNNFTPGGTWAASDYIKVIDEYAAVDYQAKYRTFAMLSTNEKKLFPGATEETFVPGWYECGKTGLMSLTATFRGNEDVKAGSGFLAKCAKAGGCIMLPSAL